jgi:hypothetical protein
VLQGARELSNGSGNHVRASGVENDRPQWDVGSDHCYFTIHVLISMALFVDLLFWPVLPHRPFLFSASPSTLKACLKTPDRAR